MMRLHDDYEELLAPRFSMHFTHLHCSCMSQIEQWLSILQRKRLAVSDFADLEGKILTFIAESNEIAHPFAWRPNPSLSWTRNLAPPPPRSHSPDGCMRAGDHQLAERCN